MMRRLLVNLLFFAVGFGLAWVAPVHAIVAAIAYAYMMQTRRPLDATS